jgi:hypothetical protein
VPHALTEAMNDGDTVAAKRAVDAMMTMGKIDIARIEPAWRMNVAQLVQHLERALGVLRPSRPALDCCPLASQDDP